MWRGAVRLSCDDVSPYIAWGIRERANPRRPADRHMRGAQRLSTTEAMTVSSSNSRLEQAEESGLPDTPAPVRGF